LKQSGYFDKSMAKRRKKDGSIVTVPWPRGIARKYEMFKVGWRTAEK
jgi:hypothetical protein